MASARKNAMENAMKNAALTAIKNAIQNTIRNAVRNQPGYKEKLFDENVSQRISNLLHYKELNYEIVNEDEWRQLP